MYANAALDTASIDLKPRFVSYLMKYPLHLAQDTGKTIHYGRVFESFDRKSIWRSEYKDAWRAYIAALLATNDKNNAFMLLVHYEKEFGLSGIEAIPGLAHFAFEQGFRTPEIEQSTLIYRKSLDGNVYLCEYLQQHKGNVAVVASGPYERGKGKGKEIDAYGAIARTFYKIDSELARDYGRGLLNILVSPVNPI